jgi:hypothetical protein
LAVTFDKRPIYLGDRIVLTAEYTASETDLLTSAVVNVPGILIDAIIVMNTEAPTNVNMKTAGNTNTPTQAVIGDNRRSFTILGGGSGPGTDNGTGKLMIYGRRA